MADQAAEVQPKDRIDTDAATALAANEAVTKTVQAQLDALPDGGADYTAYVRSDFANILCTLDLQRSHITARQVG